MISQKEMIIHLSASICEIFEAGLDYEFHFKSSLMDLSKEQLVNLKEEDIKQAIIKSIPDLIRSIQSTIKEVELLK